MSENKKICFIIKSTDNNIEKIKDTINSINNFELNNKKILVTISKDNIIKETLKQKNIDFYEYNNIIDIYHNLQKNMDYDYITYINSGDVYLGNANILSDKISNRDLYICRVNNIDEKYNLNSSLSKKDWISIEEFPKRTWIQLKSTFISKSLMNKIHETDDENYKYYNEINLVTKLIIINGGYNTIRGLKLITNDKLEDSKINLSEEYELSWYEELFDNIKNCLEYTKNNYGFINRYIQYQSLYLIKNIMLRNVNEKNKHILNTDKLKQFYENMKEVLISVEDKLILETNSNKLFNHYLLKIKYDTFEKENEYIEYNNDIALKLNNQIILNASMNNLNILIMENNDNSIKITANYPFPYDEKKLNIYALYMGKKYNAKTNTAYSKYKVFGKEIYENYVFDIVIPLKTSNEKEYIEFYLETKNSNVKLDINFSKALAKLTKHKNAYWAFDKFTLNYRKHSILVLKNSSLRHLKRELKYIISLILSKNSTAIKSGLLRIVYWITHVFYKKRIWLFEDKIYKAGDNGEYMYTYATGQKDGIKKYYILKKGCIDEKRFKKEHKKYVIYGTLRHKLLFLNSDIVFTTHNNAIKHHSFGKIQERYFRDLFNNSSVCIQHGLTVQNIANLTNRINDNLKMYFLASPVEFDNLKNKDYGYDDDSILKITGSPRYDGLKNNDKKQILITPTWRSYLALPVLKFGESRSYNNEFKNSDYYKIYNKIINSKELIDTAKKTGYKIVYLLHPCTSSQIDDFERNDYVELIAATDNLNYEKILTESSLMVTDYSGVQFDFAYMYKPIIYLHPDELPPSYEEGAYKYETMALGEIVKNSDQLIKLVCDYMNNDCKIKNEYKKRIDKFFNYHDFNNCKRIYEEIMNNKEVLYARKK